MAGYGYGISVSGTRALGQAVASAPIIPSDGLSLWLKADAGLTTTPETFISQLVVSGAGTTTSNGTYTRTSGGNTSFISGNNVISTSDGEEWYLYDDTASADTYYIIGSDFSGTWEVYAGDPDAPTSSTSTTPTGTLFVTGWADQSGNGRNASSNEGTATFSTFSGKSFVSFPAYTNLAGYNAIWSETDLIVGTILIVLRFPSSGATTFVFSHDPLMRLARDQQSNIVLTVDDIEIVTSSGTLSNNTNYLMEATFDTNNLFLYLNGTSNGSGAGQSSYGAAPYVIGGWENPSSIAEVVVYNRVLTTPERQQVEAYLNAKYAIY